MITATSSITAAITTRMWNCSVDTVTAAVDTATDMDVDMASMEEDMVTGSTEEDATTRATMTTPVIRVTTPATKILVTMMTATTIQATKTKATREEDADTNRFVCT